MNLRHMRIVCILLYWLNKGISMWNDKNANLLLFLSRLSVSGAQQKVKKRNREFSILREKEREREEVNGGQVARFPNFHIFSLTRWLNVEKMRQWLDLTMWDQSKHPTQNLGMKAWWIELSQHLFFCQTAGSWEEHFYICRFSLLILASLCNNTLTQLPKASNNYLQK